MCVHVLEPSWRMMIACGPFCSGCSSLLRVEACQRCARTQAAVDTERLFTALNHCVLRGGAYCANGLALRIRQAPRSLRPKDVQRLAAVRARDILVIHLASRVCCLIKNGSAPALVELADAAAHLTAPPALAFVVLGRGRGLATLDVSCA